MDRCLAFLSSRPAKAKRTKGKEEQQIWLIDPTGGEAWPITECPRGVLHFGWSGSNALVFAAQEDAWPARDGAERRQERHLRLVVEDEAASLPFGCSAIEVKSKKDFPHQRQLRPHRAPVRLARRQARRHRSLAQLCASPTTTRLSRSCSSTTSPAGTRRRVLGRPQAQHQHGVLVAGQQELLRHQRIQQQAAPCEAGVTELYHYDLATARRCASIWTGRAVLPLRKSNEEHPALFRWPTAFWRCWPTAFVIGRRSTRGRRQAERTSVQPAMVDRGACEQRVWPGGERRQDDPVRPLDGQHVRPSGITPVWTEDGCTRENDRGVKRTSGNQRKARTEVVRWKGAMGEEVEGLLFYPHEYKAGTQGPAGGADPRRSSVGGP